jgi:septum formation protein
LNSKNNLVLGADTVVVLGEEVLGKPENELQAEQFLARLSGRRHRVMTSVAIFDESTKVWDGGVVTSWVEFRDLARDEIKEYVATGEPMDKAGAYAIQGGAKVFVQKVEGEYDNIVGLPMRLVEDILKRNAWHVDKK